MRKSTALKGKDVSVSLACSASGLYIDALEKNITVVLYSGVLLGNF